MGVTTLITPRIEVVDLGNECPTYNFVSKYSEVAVWQIKKSGESDKSDKSDKSDITDITELPVQMAQTAQPVQAVVWVQVAATTPPAPTLQPEHVGTGVWAAQPQKLIG